MTTKKMQQSDVIQDQLWRAHVASEYTAADIWDPTFGWILKEHAYVSCTFLP